MQENKKEFKPKQPEYKGDGIAVWLDKTREGKTMLRIRKPEWGKTLIAFKNEPKPKEQAKPKIEEDLY